MFRWNLLLNRLRVSGDSVQEAKNSNDIKGRSGWTLIAIVDGQFHLGSLST
jgi:hypothetical protein